MAKLALFPVYLYEEGVELPKTGKYYLITSNGVFFHKETLVGSGLVKVNGVPWLESASPKMNLSLPKIPGRIIGQALTFFRKVFHKLHAESYVTLMYSPVKGSYRLWCPTQVVSHGGVSYDRADQPTFEEREIEKWQMVGTIHSHCDFSAFHSGTDTSDEASFDGVHITLGHVNRDQFSMVSSLAFNNQREQMEPENCCNGILRVANKAVVKSTFMTFGDATYFELALTDEDAQGLVADMEMIDNEWMPKVSARVYQQPTGKAGQFTGGTFRNFSDLHSHYHQGFREEFPQQEGAWE